MEIEHLSLFSYLATGKITICINVSVLVGVAPLVANTLLVVAPPNGKIHLFAHLQTQQCNNDFKLIVQIMLDLGCPHRGIIFQYVFVSKTVKARHRFTDLEGRS